MINIMMNNSHIPKAALLVRWLLRFHQVKVKEQCNKRYERKEKDSCKTVLWVWMPCYRHAWDVLRALCF